MSIITVNPKIRIKGFSSIKVNLGEVDEFEFSFKKINFLADNISKYNLSTKDQKIILKIKDSYVKAKNGEDLSSDDMVLKNQENLEMKLLSEDKLEK